MSEVAPGEARTEAMKMDHDERPEAEKNLGLFLSPSVPGGGGFLVPMESLAVGPGEPGPEDDWAFPAEPTDEAASETAPTTESPGSR
jgi:hypothetical protein